MTDVLTNDEHKELRKILLGFASEVVRTNRITMSSEAYQVEKTAMDAIIAFIERREVRVNDHEAAAANI